jgi:hypothetical protein
VRASSREKRRRYESQAARSRFFLLRAARDDFGASFGASVMIIFLLTSMSDDSIQSTQLQQKTAANFHEEWKGRIDPWQPKRKRRRKQRSTKNLQ